MSVRVYFCSFHSKGFRHHTIESEQERHWGGCLFQQIVVIVPKLQREDVVIERQMKGKAAKSAPCPQYRHSFDT